MFDDADAGEQRADEVVQKGEVALVERIGPPACGQVSVNQESGPSSPPRGGPLFLEADILSEGNGSGGEKA